MWQFQKDEKRLRNNNAEPSHWSLAIYVSKNYWPFPLLYFLPLTLCWARFFSNKALKSSKPRQNEELTCLSVSSGFLFTSLSNAGGGNLNASKPENGCNLSSDEGCCSKIWEIMGKKREKNHQNRQGFFLAENRYLFLRRLHKITWIIYHLLTSSVRSLQGNLRPRPWCTDRAIDLLSACARKRSFEVVFTEPKQTWRCDWNHKTQFHWEWDNFAPEPAIN